MSLTSISKEHHFMILRYYNGQKTEARKKEYQSSLVFFRSNPRSQDIGAEWKKKYAHNVKIAAIHLTLKSLYPLTGIKVHRVCKVKYTLLVFISNNYERLRVYLESFDYLPGRDVLPLYSAGDPFTIAEEELAAISLHEVMRRLIARFKYHSRDIIFITSVKDHNNKRFFFLAEKSPNGINTITNLVANNEDSSDLIKSHTISSTISHNGIAYPVISIKDMLN